MRPRHAMGDQTSTATTRRALSGATLDLPGAGPSRGCRGRDICRKPGAFGLFLRISSFASPAKSYGLDGHEGK